MASGASAATDIKAGQAAAPASALGDWLEQRRGLVERLNGELRTGFDSVAAFDAAGYLDSVERQEDLCRQVGDLDRKMPATDQTIPNVEVAAFELRQMNAELKRLADVQRALVEHGSRSIRCFQRVWAMGAAEYEPPGR